MQHYEGLFNVNLCGYCVHELSYIACFLGVVNGIYKSEIVDVKVVPPPPLSLSEREGVSTL